MDINLRAARPDDALGMAKVHVDTWRATYPGVVPADFLEDLSYPSTAAGWQKAITEIKSPGEAILVAENEALEIVGITSCGPERSQDPLYQGEIYVLYVLPEYQGQGIGRRLVAACAQHLLHQLGVETLLVWVVAENPYRRFYESLGGRLVREKAVEVGGKTVLDVGYGWEEIHRLA